MTEQLPLFDLPKTKGFKVLLKSLRHPVWTENKARLIQRYLRYFVLITKHGVYIDGFAGPQYPDKPDAWAARLVLESEPRWLNAFYLCDQDPAQVALLVELRDSQPPRCSGESKRTIHVYPGDFNVVVQQILADPAIHGRAAAFCLLDQHSTEVNWATVETLARHKSGSRKIELFYFLAVGWLGRALAGTRDVSRLEAWWGPDWQRFRGLSKQEQNNIFCQRLQEELGYQSALGWLDLRAPGWRTYHVLHDPCHRSPRSAQADEPCLQSHCHAARTDGAA